MELSRPQVLIAMGVTAILLGAIAKVWLWLGNVRVLALSWNGVAIAQGLAVGICIVSLSQAVYYLWPAYKTSAETYMNVVLRPLTWPDLVWLGLLPGLSEELLFRGVALAVLGVTPGGIAISSLIFGSMHLLDIEQWPYGVWATVVGVILGISVMMTGNLLVPIVAHIFANTVSSGLWKAYKQKEA
ncbi:MAG: CPBP family intramembrane glutamic endopeptidase [Cyanobacteria bacterium J06642_2]